jgi:hypothetical protein
MRAAISRTRSEQVLRIAFIVLLVPVILGVLVPWLVFYLLFKVCLHVAIWTLWCGTRRDVLFVYSDSPIWHDYLEQNILTRLGNRAVVLNWSQRKSWPVSLAKAAFWHFGGHREFNPMAVVFRPFRPTRVFRFWRPFQDFKNGRPAALEELQSNLLSYLEH